MPVKKRNPAAEKRLASEANRHYRAARRAWKHYLDHAKTCGDALRELRLYVWSGWKKWVRENLDFSYETAKVYMRISKNWNHPRIEQARREGITIDSIVTFFKLLQGRSLDPAVPPSKSARGEDESQFRYNLRQSFAQALKNLVLEELEQMDEHFDEYWGRWYAQVYEDACNAMQDDLNTSLLECRAITERGWKDEKSLSRAAARRQAEAQARSDSKIGSLQKRKEHVKYLRDTKEIARQRRRKNTR